VRTALATILAACLLCAVACGDRTAPPAGASGGRGGGGAGRAPVQFPVEVVPVQARDVEYSLSAVGSVEAFEVVQVTARVPGVVEAVRFQEGDWVRPDQVLVEIEPQRYRLAAEAARATLEKTEAEKAEAEAGLQRREGATSRNPGLIPGEEIETWRTRVRTAAADLAQARAALDQAELNVRDAYVRAGVGGAIQTRSVQTGQYVQPGVTLATLVRRDPLLLRFQVPEPDAAQVHPGMEARFRLRDSQATFKARIAHVATSADPASRMVAVTAHVDASGPEAPRPGAFAEVTVPVGSTSGAPVVPETAVRPSERGFLAYVIEGGKARERVLELGMRTADGLVEVRAGLAPAESLVVRGAEALRDGAGVRVVPPGGTPPRGTGAGAPPTPAGGGAS
jgi:multidrug efflux system membrane fusion protein